MKKLLISSLSALFIFLMGTSFAPISDNPDAIVGVWKTGEGNAMVRIYKNGETKQDKNHPDEANRTRPVLGMINIWGFSYKDKNLWDDGNIYDPKNGSTYSCTIKMINPNTLEVRGYIGVSIIGRTDNWTRQQAK